jgi:hypothetical protein
MVLIMLTNQHLKFNHIIIKTNINICKKCCPIKTVKSVLTKLHGVEPCVDVKNKVHFEGLALAEEAAY